MRNRPMTTERRREIRQLVGVALALGITFAIVWWAPVLIIGLLAGGAR